MTTLVTKGDIINGLKRMGLGSGHKALVHSSLSSFGVVEGGADTVIDALIETVGPRGTILVPTLTGHSTLSPSNPPQFDPVLTPCWTGRVPETFRKRQDAVRSLHPTHSVAAIGADAVSLTRDHFFSVTPCDEMSPYGKLAHCQDSYIVLIGVGHEVSTTFHHIEEVVGVEYHMQKEFVRARIIVDGQKIHRHVMIHRYGAPRNFGVMEPIFEEQGIQTKTKIGDSDVRLVNVNRMVRTTIQCLRANKKFLCDSTSPS